MEDSDKRKYDSRLTPARLRLRGKGAALTRWAKTPSEERSEVNRRGAQTKLLKLADEIDPEHLLDDAERMTLAKELRKARMVMLRAKRD